jgi:hypothetical protein
MDVRARAAIFLSNLRGLLSAGLSAISPYIILAVNKFQKRPFLRRCKSPKLKQLSPLFRFSSKGEVSQKPSQN